MQDQPDRQQQCRHRRGPGGEQHRDLSVLAQDLREVADEVEREAKGECGINTSGGLIAKGHPVGATGVAMIGWSMWQLQGKVPPELQVPDPKLAATFNYDTLLEDPEENPFLEKFYRNRQQAALAT